MAREPGIEPIPRETEEFASIIVDAAVKVHRVLGPGLLEGVYEACLGRELQLRSTPFRSQVSVPVLYEGIKLETGFRVDLLVGERVVVELKAVEALLPVHRYQLLTYLKLMDLRLGLLINFNVPHIRDGIKRVIL
jgi:GxxExxY protein